MKKLLTTLLIECIKRDFKTTAADGKTGHAGMCSIASDLESEKIITFEDFKNLTVYIYKNKLEDVNEVTWYDFTEDGKMKRIEWMINSIIKESIPKVEISIDEKGFYSIENKRRTYKNKPQ